ncbi:hypothetical protein ULM_34360 (plasmid) [Legionella pneumophila]|nr:hypothetical protein ULM_34360 [Legionella pneumophila]
MIWEITLKKITDTTANHAAQKWVKTLPILSLSIIKLTVFIDLNLMDKDFTYA